MQLHLRVRPELVELIDAYRGPATRNAYAGMILEWELKRRHSDAHESMIALADRALTQDPAMAAMELASGIPAEEIAEAVRLGPSPCSHPAGRRLKGLCMACGTHVGT